jgi:dTDP-glucose 4,6-dehydratase
MHPVAFIENNVSVALQMLEYARMHPCQRFVQFSSDEVFGPDGEGPSSPYAASKAAQESIAHAYRRTYGVPVVVTNSSNIIGPMQDAEKFLPRVARAVQSSGFVTIHQHLGVVGSRFYDVVDNVASALVFICERTMSGEYQLGPGTELTNLEMAQRIADTLELPLNYELVEVGSIRPGYDQHYHHVGNILSGWEPVSTFDEGLVRAVDAPAVVPR